MARGGKREGAGRPKGSASRKTREVADRAAEEGLLPLDYMLKVMRDEGADQKRRDGMAIAAAPYLHPKLSAVEHGGVGGGAIQHEHGLTPALQRAIDKIVERTS